MLKDALLAGRIVRKRLLDVLHEAAPYLPVDIAALRDFDEPRLKITDSLALRFANMTAIVQDQLVRLVLLLEEEDLTGLSRRDLRLKAEKLGALAPHVQLDRIGEIRNRVAHQYPHSLERQARLINDIAAQTAPLIAAYDGLAAFSSDRFFAGQAISDDLKI